VSDLTRAGRNYIEIKVIVDTVYGYIRMKKRQIFEILKKVKDDKIPTTRRVSNSRKLSRLARSRPL
jgi:hypothetical protein